MSNANSTNQMLKLMTSSGHAMADAIVSSSDQVAVDSFGEKKLQLTPSPSMVDLLNLCLNPDATLGATPK